MDLHPSHSFSEKQRGGCACFLVLYLLNLNVADPNCTTAVPHFHKSNAKADDCLNSDAYIYCGGSVLRPPK